MKKISTVLLFIAITSSCFVAGLFVGLDQKETMKQSFRSALHQAQTHLKSLQLQTQPDKSEALLALTQRSLELNLQSMVLMYMSDYEIDQHSFQSAQKLIKDMNEFSEQQNMTLFSDKNHWRFPETVAYIQNNLVNITNGAPADKREK
ncbi:hypothetical protein [Marinicella rhabdoformis]|uniref:hypothetical protein n=1 Tax=Marinicella rhabdoformis TaxID=2580566 RepID=UPI0012AEC1ED|nr:hypothetical protein [Marinicella rhabdoformis]